MKDALLRLIKNSGIILLWGVSVAFVCFVVHWAFNDTHYPLWLDMLICVSCILFSSAFLTFGDILFKLK